VSDLVARLTSALDEDERVAKAASPGPWQSHDVDPEYGKLHYYGDFGWYVRGPAGSPEFEDSDQGRADADHVARHDPARTLRMVAAHRIILDLYEQARRRAKTAHHSVDQVRAMARMVALTDVVEALAEMYGVTVEEQR